MIRTLCHKAAIAICLITGAATPVSAQVLHTTDSVVSVTLLEGWRLENGAHYAGIQIDLAPGWKTYWRAPGDGGIPTTVTWNGSENLKEASIMWPRPVVFRAFGMRSVGYADRVVLPVHLEAETNGPISIKMNMRLGVCKEICLPVDVAINSRLHPNHVEGMVPIQTALTDRPKPVEARLDCSLTKVGDEYRLDIATNVPPLHGNAETSVVELADKMVWVSEPEFLREDDWVMSSVRLIPQNARAKIDLSTLRLTMLTTTSAVELSGCD